MGAAALGLAFALSLTPALLAWTPDGRLALVGAWQTPLALLPWLALAGFPRRAGSDSVGAVSAAALVACFLPSLGLSLAADLRCGRAPLDLARVAIVGVALCALLGAAAARARGGRAHALAWLVTVPGLAALGAARAVAGRWPEALSGLAALPAASPLVWSRDAALRGPESAGWGALCVALALLMLSARVPARAEVTP